MFNRWYNCALTQRYFRNNTLRNTLRGWREVVFQKGKATKDIRRGRHLLFNLITKLRQSRASLLAQAFSKWSGKSESDFFPAKSSNTSTSVFNIMAFTPKKKALDKHHLSNVGPNVLNHSWREGINKLRLSKASLTASKFRSMTAQYSELSSSIVYARQSRADENSNGTYKPFLRKPFLANNVQNSVVEPDTFSAYGIEDLSNIESSVLAPGEEEMQSY